MYKVVNFWVQGSETLLSSWPLLPNFPSEIIVGVQAHHFLIHLLNKCLLFTHHHYWRTLDNSESSYESISLLLNSEICNMFCFL